MAACLAALSPAAHAAGAGGWEWTIAPYIWVVDIDTDMDIDVPPPGIEREDTDIIDRLDGVFQLHVEGRTDHFGMFTDFTYYSLSDDSERTFSNAASDLDARLFELAAAWYPGDRRDQGLGVFAGLRYIDLDLRVRLDPANPAFDTATVDVGERYADLMLGARYTWAYTDRWGMTLRGDGSFGETEGTWNASAIGHYRTELGAWLFGYRYMAGTLGTAGSEIDIAMHGPVFGYGFNF